MRLLTLITSLLLALPAHADNGLPPQYIGIWATENSVFRGSSLIGGTAIYLDIDGEGAMVGAPLPVGMCGDRICTPIIGMPLHASLGQDRNTIRAALTDGRETVEILLSYDPESKILVMASGKDKGQQFVRRKPELPSDIKAALRANSRSTSRAQ